MDIEEGDFAIANVAPTFFFLRFALRMTIRTSCEQAATLLGLGILGLGMDCDLVKLLRAIQC